MGGINYKRVLAGGLIAGIVFIIADALFPVVFRASAERWLAEMGFAAPGAAGIVVGILLMLVVGVIVVWLYAAMRPRYGAGPTTAGYTALAAWALAIVAPSVSFATLGMTVDAGFWLFLVWWLVFITAGTVAGAWLYQEEVEPTVAPRPAVAPAVDE